MTVDTKDSASVCSYINKNYRNIVSLYNKGEYESFIAEFEKFENNYKLREIIYPILENCRNLTNKYMWPKDRIHFRNELILRYFGWIDNIKYITGLVSLHFFARLFDYSEETFYANLLEHPTYLFWAVLLAILTYMLHTWMKKFTISGGLIRCKYCGRYTYSKYRGDNPYEANNCRKCKKTNPVPDFYWDSLVALENMEERYAVQEDFYRELKEKYSSKYAIWKQSNKEGE